MITPPDDDAVPPEEAEETPPDWPAADNVPAGAAEPTVRPPPPPRPPRPKEPRTIPIFLGVFAGFLAAGTLVYFFGPGSELRPFKPHLAEYARTKDLKNAYTPPPGAVGKVLVIDADLGEIDPNTFRLPDDLRPKRHEDVGTVVIHRRQPAKEFGHYTEDQLAFVQVWRLILIDRASGTLYHWQDIDGPPPRAKVQTNEGNQTGPPPADEMLKAISDLKRLPMTKPAG